MLKLLTAAALAFSIAAPALAAPSDDLAQVPALQGWRRSVFGEKALALKDGSLSLRIQRGRVVVG